MSSLELPGWPGQVPATRGGHMVWLDLYNLGAHFQIKEFELTGGFN